MNVIHIYMCRCTWAVRKVSVCFEYLENQPRGLDVTGQPVRGDLSFCEHSLSCGASQSAVRRR
jgi:hypothetical protein